jgi:hypothetical protein
MREATSSSLTAAAHGAVRDSLLRLGFDDDAVLRDYVFSVGEGQTAKADVLAFAHPRHRTPADYAAISAMHIAGALEPSRAADMLSKSGAIFHLLDESNAFHLWVSAFDEGLGEPVPRRVQEGISYDRLPEALGAYGADLTPQKIVGVKQGREWFANDAFRNVGAQQMTLWVMDVTRPLLREHFDEAVQILRAAQDETEGWTDDDTTRIAVQLLGGVVLADTGALSEVVRQNRDLSLERLWIEGHARFPPYFAEIPRAARRAAERALSLLRQISYAGFEPEMLVELYTRAYRKEQRRQLGRFDTPMYLTRAIWEHIPVELLPPEKRVVCDMTAGWGSFLVAGYERLTRIGDMGDRPLNRHLFGNDISASAALLARFGLLISTGHDSWKVDAQDALRWRWLADRRPDIIVGNPPFGGSRNAAKTEEEQAKAERTRTEKAVPFLDRAIERLAPGGYLAMVMPLSFIASEAGAKVRERLYRECDVMDIWEVPNAVFRDAAVAPAVLFARKHPVADRGGTLVSVRTLQTAHLDDFKKHGVFTSTAVVAADRLWTDVPTGKAKRKKTHVMAYNLVLQDEEWGELAARCVTLENRANIFQGCIQATVRSPARPSDLEPYEVDYLWRFPTVVPEPLRIKYGTERRTYPTDFNEPRIRVRALLGSAKVLINSTTNPSWGRRLTAAIDRQGYYISDKFWGLVPSEEGIRAGVNLEVLAAVLSWHVANGWIAGSLRHGKIPRPAIGRIPFPREIPAEAVEALTRAVKTIEDPARDTEAPGAWALIDRVLAAAYGISDRSLEKLRLVGAFSGQTGPAAVVPVAPPSPWHVEGVVEEVSAEGQTLTVWLNGFDNLQEVHIQPHMPAWLLREGAAFRTAISDAAWQARDLTADPRFGRFSVAPYTYLDEGEVLDRLAGHVARGDG